MKRGSEEMKMKAWLEKLEGREKGDLLIALCSFADSDSNFSNWSDPDLEKYPDPVTAAGGTNMLFLLFFLLFIKNFAVFTFYRVK